MTIPTDDAGPLADLQEAVETFKAAILSFFETNPLPAQHPQVDRERLHTEVVTRIQQQPAAPRAAAGARRPPHTAAPKAGTGHAGRKAVAPAKDGDLSGPAWNERFPEDTRGVDGLDPGFGAKVTAFINAMENANIKVYIAGARRLKARAYLMHWSYMIKHGTPATEADEKKNELDGVKIRWAHTKEDGSYDSAASLAAAEALYSALGVAKHLGVAPSLKSHHIEGKAVDLDITGWDKPNIEVVDAHGKKVRITTFDDLRDVGKSYGVYNFPTKADPNHWSCDQK